MANYVKATNFAAKDALPSGNAGKIVKGTELDTEFTAIASAISSKADLNSPALTGTPTAPTAATGTNTTQLATTAFVSASFVAELATERTATATLTNKTISADNNTISGIAASSFVLSNSSGNIDGSAAQKAIPSGVVVGTTDTQTLTNKTLSSPTISGTVTDGTSSTAVKNIIVGSAKVWVAYNVNGQSILGSHNVSSVTYNGTGDFTVNFTTALPNTNYATVATASRSDTANGTAIVVDGTNATGSVRIKTIVNFNTLYSDTYTSVVCFSS